MDESQDLLEQERSLLDLEVTKVCPMKVILSNRCRFASCPRPWEMPLSKLLKYVATFYFVFS